MARAAAPPRPFGYNGALASEDRGVAIHPADTSPSPFYSDVTALLRHFVAVTAFRHFLLGVPMPAVIQ